MHSLATRSLETVPVFPPSKDLEVELHSNGMDLLIADATRMMASPLQYPAMTTGPWFI
jgi:hypothetical protein